jgi:2-aminoadipate transaminase
MQSLRPSVIREIFKYAADPTVITLAAGSPAPEATPIQLAQRLLEEVLTQTPMVALQYSQSEGYPLLREALKEYLSSRHDILKDFDDLIVTSGAQQCMDLVTKVFCNEGDTVICEDPSFIGSLNTFRSYNVNLVGVPMEEDGISIEKLEQALQENPATRFLYVIPNFQNPTGITMSLAKRRQVYELAKKYGTLILEDNPYGDLRFAGENLPSIKSMDTDEIVLYAGTFSKILSPGIRVGYLIAPTEALGKIVVAKQCTDVHTNMLGQTLCHRFLTECDVDAHIASLKATYAHKCGLMLTEMAKHFPAGLTWTKPTGGLFIWANLGVDTDAFATRLVKEKKVCIVPGSAFGAKADIPSQSARFNFSTPTDENIVAAIARTGELLEVHSS